MNPSNNLRLSALSTVITTGKPIPITPPHSGSPTTTTYILTDLSCLGDVPDAICENIMKHLTAVQTTCTVTCPGCPCYFLHKIPIEIRNHIYGYLLTNPDLSECSPIKDEKVGAEISYGLTPSIIATCKQIGQEASQVLYSRNVFFMAVAPSSIVKCYQRFPLLSPLTRFNENISFSAISKVRNWKITSLGNFEASGDNLKNLTRFFLAISTSKLRSLELLLSPKINRDYGEYLRPFQFLQNIRNFHARALSEMEISRIFHFRKLRRGSADILEVSTRTKSEFDVELRSFKS
jgi:hypothetical protein